ncbi:ATP-dependent helicase [Cumulibacter soli]|uniref:ATP-dependent helicase n=1 Tax=Cumulibacter soli TaxID=2546344 RepID=UPI001067BD75|nr:ATP-dependent DNA helicase [Cumulibacter soli]
MTAQFSPADIAAHTGAHTPTEEQAAVIGAPLGPSAIVAGAGSGKTETMAARVVWLVCNGVVEPDRVLGLTFTRKAASELAERVRNRLREASVAIGDLDPARATAMRSAEPTVLTYDSYARRIVAEHGLRLGIEPGVQTADAAALWQLAQQVVTAYDGPLEEVDRTSSTIVQAVVALSDEMAAHLVGVDDVVAASTRVIAQIEQLERAGGKALASTVRRQLDGVYGRVLLAPVLAGFAERKRDGDLMSFGDMLSAACRLSSEQPAIGEQERDRYDVVLLDEYQDTSGAQAALLRSLYAGHPITAVGDPCQAIYGFRGASADTLTAFRMQFGDGVAIPMRQLSTTFRNDRAILQIANEVSAPLRAWGAEVAVLDAGPAAGPGELAVGLFETTKDEAAAVAADIASRWEPGASSVAVLSRARSEEFGAVIDALVEQGLPIEVVGLSGLLSLPEIREIVNTLSVLTRPSSDAELIQLLGGRRWRIAPSDLVALSTYAKRLAGRGSDEADDDEVDESSLVDALDQIRNADEAAFSERGWHRLNAYAGELAELRALMGEPLADLVGAIERAIGVDIESTVRDVRRELPPRAALDQFTGVAHAFSAGSGTQSTEGFLQYLDAAEEADRGITRDGTTPRRDAVQVLTMHASKGLEWDSVYIIGATDKALPGDPKPATAWLKDLGTLPYELRSDAAALPRVDISEVQQTNKVNTEFVGQMKEQVKEHHGREQRRLVYVALTRARHRLWMSAARWKPTAKKSRVPSEYLTLMREHVERTGGQLVAWAPQPEDGAENPASADLELHLWPASALSAEQTAARAAAEQFNADVAEAMGRSGIAALPQHSESAHESASGQQAEPAQQSTSLEQSASLQQSASLAEQPRHPWLEATELLLAERAARRAGTVVDVEAPDRLSASQLVAIRRDPVQFALDIRRPVPRLLRAAADRGTLFHSWVEHRFGSDSLIDIDDLPGASDEGLEADASIDDLIERFESSEWASRRPLETETGFDLMVDGIPLRGRLDAVFEWPGSDADYDVIDWKTGRRPTGEALAAAEVQLAVYRLAWSRIAGVDPQRVRAGFFYVADGITHRPDRVLDERDLIDLVRTLPEASTIEASSLSS